MDPLSDCLSRVGTPIWMVVDQVHYQPLYNHDDMITLIITIIVRQKPLFSAVPVKYTRRWLSFGSACSIIVHNIKTIPQN